MEEKRSADSYRVVVTKRGSNPDQWEWEILRNDRPLPARMRDGPLKSERVAEAFGRLALREFLDLLKQEGDARPSSGVRLAAELFGRKN